MGKIADIIYRELSYMYCDNCRHSKNPIDEYGVDHCEDCHRKHNGWGVSKAEADRIEKLCEEEEGKAGE